MIIPVLILWKFQFLRDSFDGVYDPEICQQSHVCGLLQYLSQEWVWKGEKIDPRSRCRRISRILYATALVCNGCAPAPLSSVTVAMGKNGWPSLPRTH